MSPPVTEAATRVPPLQVVLGRMAERNMDLLLTAGRLESRLLSERLEQVAIERPIYVCGLARAGSTILLETLAAHEAVVTHRYQDFPLVMLPYWWSRFLQVAGRRATARVERSHRDGLTVTPESPEAMEEILWMAFFGGSGNPDYPGRLEADTVAPAFEAAYRDMLRKLLLARGGRRYVAKNNTNLARLSYLANLFPDARFVIPVRAPVNHIGSLIKQHRLLSEAQRRDTRVRAYMRRAGHFEFGLDRRPIAVPSAAAAEEVRRLWAKGWEIAGWARYWRHLHGHLREQLAADSHLAARTAVIAYEDLCMAPWQTLRTLYEHVDLKVKAATLEWQSQRIRAPNYYEPALSKADRAVIQNETAEVYAALV